MKQLQKQVFKSLAVLLCLISIGAYGQKQKKTFSESFNVGDDAVLDINTSHADISFDTWNKNEVLVEATIELEGASDEEAKAYFENGGFEIMGNSSKVTVATGSERPRLFDSFEGLHIELPEMPEFESFDFDFDFDFSELEDLPVMPPVPHPNFDYEAFKKDGEKYIKEWQKNFQKDFGEPYQQKMEAWQQKMEAKRNEMQERRAKMHEKRVEAHEQRAEKMAEARAERTKKRTEAHLKRAEAHKKRMEKHTHRTVHRDSSRFLFIDHEDDGNRPSIFYFNSDGKNKNYKVKKTIKIKMPKSMKIKMNVRHGEVKLAENTKNIDANLSHASLFASTIDGDKTTVMVSYSPVSVDKWNFGQLQADYSEHVDLREVSNLRLSATFSEVTIDNLVKTAFIKNSFGPLLINAVSNDFETLDVSLQNAELICDLPETAFAVYVNGTQSKLTCPPEFKLDKTVNHENIVHRGHNRSENSDKSVNIHSKYSEVVLK